MKHLKIFEEFSDQNNQGEWVIFAGLSGGFGGANEQGIWSGDKSEAESESYRMAVEEYEGMEGMHGLRTVEEIMEEDQLEADDAQYEYNEEREGWLDYWVEEFDHKKHYIEDLEKLN